MKILIIWLIAIAALIFLVVFGVWIWIVLKPLLAIPVLVVYGLGAIKIIGFFGDIVEKDRMEKVKRMQSDPNYSAFHRRPPRED